MQAGERNYPRLFGFTTYDIRSSRGSPVAPLGMVKELKPFHYIKISTGEIYTPDLQLCRVLTFP